MFSSEQINIGMADSHADGPPCQTDPQPEIFRPLKNFAMIGKSGSWALLLYQLIRSFQPRNCLELGTCLGFSAAYQSLALRFNAQKAQFISLEGIAALAEHARKNFTALGLDNAQVITGLFTQTLPPTLRKIQSLDYVFVDGHHEEEATKNYYRQLLPFLSNNAIVVFDDISWTKGMRKAWEVIAQDKNVKIAVDLFVVGIVIITKSTG